MTVGTVVLFCFFSFATLPVRECLLSRKKVRFPLPLLDGTPSDSGWVVWGLDFKVPVPSLYINRNDREDRVLLVP